MKAVDGDALLALVREGYAAFARSDVDAALALFAQDAEYVVAGESAISGTYRGHDDILKLWSMTAAAGLSLTTDGFFTDGERVVVLVTERVGAIEWRAASIFAFDDSRVVRFESIEDSARLAQAFPPSA